MKNFTFKRKNWYIASLSLPILLPLILRMFNADGILMLSLHVCGMYYLVFILGLLYWGRNKTADAMFRVSWKVPLFFAGIVTTVTSAIEMMAGNFLFVESLIVFLSVLIIAYGYVIITHCITYCFHKMGILTE